MRKYMAELIGTFALVFTGTGAIIINDVSGGVITHVGIALTFGLVVMAVIYAIGDISGAHLNPAVSFGFWVSRRFSGRSVLYYIISQCSGALLASLSLRLLFMEHPTLGATLPAGPVAQSFVMEIILTGFLMFVILNVSSGAKENGLMAGIAVGAVVGLEALFAGPISGASMNPARSLAPALITENLKDLWLYIIAPLTGSYLAVFGCKIVRDKECCSETKSEGI